MRIAIIGAGVAGLRAGIELAKKHRVTIFEKSAGVGGRVATRRFEDGFVNHGATQVERRDILKEDVVGERFFSEMDFSRMATQLPKGMRDYFLELGGKLELNAKVTFIEEGNVFFEQGDKQEFDKILLTAPLPQVREILKENILADVTYDKAILFIGVVDKKAVRKELSAELSEELFELNDDEIRERCGLDTSGLQLKKWRYARVRTGTINLYDSVSEKIFVAGDAFDPEGFYDIVSAWKSGVAVAQHIF